MTGEILVLHEANPTYIKRFVGFSIACGYSKVGAPSVWHYIVGFLSKGVS